VNAHIMLFRSGEMGYRRGIGSKSQAEKTARY